LGLAQKAREANPNDPGIADTLGWIYFKKGIYATALDLLKESNEKFKGQNPTVLYHLAHAHDKTAPRRGQEKSFGRVYPSGKISLKPPKRRKCLSHSWGNRCG
jgi:uncharacterized protein HemY